MTREATPPPIVRQHVLTDGPREVVLALMQGYGLPLLGRVVLLEVSDNWSYPDTEHAQVIAGALDLHAVATTAPGVRRGQRFTGTLNAPPPGGAWYIEYTNAPRTWSAPDPTTSEIVATTLVIRHTELARVDENVRLVLVDALLDGVDQPRVEMVLREVPLMHRGLVHALGILRADALRRAEREAREIPEMGISLDFRP